jgi:hypothetical protein
MRLFSLTLISAIALFGQMKTEPAGAPPAEVSALAPALAKDGVKVLKEDGSVLCEVWLAAAEPSGGSAEQNATWAAAPQGVLLGAVRFPTRHSDRRGQQIKPGVYSMRYGLFPMNGDHQGVEPQRDFLILSPAAADTDPAAKPAFDVLMHMSRKASGTPHPLVLSFWKEDSKLPTGVEAVGESDQVLHAQIGNTTVSIIVVGKTAH